MQTLQVVPQLDKTAAVASDVCLSAEPLATRKKNRSHETTPLLSPLISTVTHPVCFIWPLTRVALSKGVRAACKGVRLPSLRGIGCRSSNASYGSLIKKKVKKSVCVWRGGRIKEEEKTEHFLSTPMHLSVGGARLPRWPKGDGRAGKSETKGDPLARNAKNATFI